MERVIEVVGVFKEIASGAKDSRPARKEVIELASKRFIDKILVTELSRWGRSTLDVISTLQELYGYNVSLFALNGTQLDLLSPNSKFMVTVLAAVSELERESYTRQGQVWHSYG